MHVTCGNFSIMDLGIAFLICSFVGQIGKLPSFTYKKLIQIINVVLPVDSVVSNRWARWVTLKLHLQHTNVRRKAAKLSRALFWPLQLSYPDCGKISHFLHFLLNLKTYKLLSAFWFLKTSVMFTDYIGGQNLPFCF